MADINQLQDALIKADAAGNTDDARALADEIRRLRNMSPTVESPTTEPSLLDRIKQTNRDIGGGFLRGAASIGSTILLPADMINQKLRGEDFFSLKDNLQRRADVDRGLQLMGSNPESGAYKNAKVDTEILGTLGVGPAIAAASRAIPIISALAESAPVIQRGINAIESGGMNIGSGGSNIWNALTRSAGGAITGGASTGLIEPDQAKSGAIIGSILPLALKSAGVVGNSVGSTVGNKPLDPNLLAAAKRASDLGYVIPPTQVNPTIKNRLLEGFAGKISTAQNASAKNSDVTNALAAASIGLPTDTKINPETLDAVRKEAGKAYEAVSKLPIQTAQKADTLLNKPAIEEINPKEMVFDLRNARNDATAWYNSYARTADPDSLAKAQAAKSSAEKIQKSLEDYAKSVGRDDLIPAMVDARQLIAKTYSIEKAFNPTTGTVDARKLGAMLEKGKPLSGGLKDAAEFANRFPKAAQTPEKMGSLPQVSPLDYMGAGTLSGVMGNPLAMAGVLARPAARAAILSRPVQRGLTKQNPNRLTEILADPELQKLFVRSSTATSAQ
jgi:hypothetical protein